MIKQHSYFACSTSICSFLNNNIHDICSYGSHTYMFKFLWTLLKSFLIHRTHGFSQGPQSPLYNRQSPLLV